MNLLERIKSIGESYDLNEGIMALLFVSGEPLKLDRMCTALDTTEDEVKRAIVEINEGLLKKDSAFNILKLGDSYQLTVRKSYNGLVKKLLSQTRNTPPSQAGLEVLAIVAYNQPVTRSFIEQVRGVECGAVIGTLVDKGLLEEAGRLELPGRPISYKTTDNFLRVFGLECIEELPDLHVTAEEKAPVSDNLENVDNLEEFEDNKE